MTKLKVLVLGGNGFIGRHAVDSLLAHGCEVTIGTRKPESTAKNKCREQQHVLHRKTQADQWHDAVEDFDVILNCVGILRQRWGETYQAVHHCAPNAIAEACQNTATRFVHVSALGLSADAKSRFLTSKYLGEAAIAQSKSDWIIAKISLLDGDGGYGASWLRGVAKLPMFVVPTSAKGKIAALTAQDAGEALSQLCRQSHDQLKLEQSRVFELGGERTVGFEHYIRGLRRRYSDTLAWCIPLPAWLSRLGAHICDVFHFSPFSFGHWELLCHDNVPIQNRLPELLGRAPTPVI